MSLISPLERADTTASESVWLFVRVIDNFGDAGVAWRLALGLIQKFDVDVCLWIDEPVVLAQLAPESTWQTLWERIRIIHWQDDAIMATELSMLANPQMVIEMFGCHLPEPVLARMSQCRPLWLNWEYLSVEDWAVDLQGMPSLQSNAVAKYFWFMGIDEASGGLLRESDYVQRQQAFQSDVQQQQTFCQQYGLPTTHQGQLWLIFAYNASIWSSWLSMWQKAGVPITLWLAGGQVIQALRQQGLLPETALLHDGTCYQYGTITFVRIAFVPQSAFDQLLWLADGAIVRGEDSLVRALWAGLPFFWHIYPQEEHIHWPKLHAFWQKITKTWSAVWCHDFNLLSDDLNGVINLDPSNRLNSWQTLMQQWLCWQQAAKSTALALHNAPTAMEKLARFRHHTLK